MKKYLLATLCLIFYFSTSVFAAADTIKVAFEREPGSLKQYLSAGAVCIDYKDTTNPWHKTYTPVKGIPKEWGAKYYVGQVELDIYQFTYQHYLLGNITEERFKSLQESWNWTPDTTLLSKETIQCYLSVILKVQPDTSIVYKFDADGDLDFSDEPLFSVKGRAYDSDTTIVHTFTYETRRNGKIIQQTSPIKLGFSDGMMWYSIPGKGIAKFTADGSSEILKINNSNDVFFKNAMIVKDSDLSSEDVWLLYIEPLQYISIQNKVYQYLGVANNGDTLLFVKQTKPADEFHSPQYGFKAPLFEDKEMTTPKTIKLEDYRGKYVLLDIWATWCLGCIQFLPYLKAAYDSLDYNKIEFISIAGESDEADIRQLLEKHNITWPQINIEKGNPIIDAYNVTGYPITLLIDPNGVVIHTQIRGEAALETIRKAMKE